MAYAIVNGTSGNNFLAYQGILQTFNQTLVNPYSGYTILINETKNINNAIYDGMNGTDTLAMPSTGDVLVLVDATGTIMLKNVEIIEAGAGGDIILIAHDTVAYGNIRCAAAMVTIFSGPTSATIRLSRAAGMIFSMAAPAATSCLAMRTAIIFPAASVWTRLRRR